MLRRWFAHSARITRRDADRLLDGERAAGGHADLAMLLTAAAGPARPDELAGEREAVAAFGREFRRETGDAAPVPARSARRPHRRATIVAVLSAATLAVGGTAYAATTGRLPDPVQRIVDGVFTGGDMPSEPRPDPASPHGGTGVSPAPTAPPSGAGSTAGPDGGTPGGGVRGADQARLTGLCRSWEATRGNPRANAISAEDLRVLAAAAGGEDRIGAFCAAVLNRTAAPQTPGKPGNPNPGGGRPTAPPGGGHTKGPKG